MLELTPQLQSMLIRTVSCGDAKLAKLIEPAVPLMWRAECAIACDAKLTRLRVQLKLVTLAQKKVSEQVDEMVRRSKQHREDHAESQNTKDGESERAAISRRANWADATSFQQFLTDRESASQSDTRAYMESRGSFFDYAWDRSAKDSWAYSRSHGRSLSTGAGSSEGGSYSKDVRESDSGADAPKGGDLWAPGPFTLAFALPPISAPDTPRPGIENMNCGSADLLNPTPCVPLTNEGHSRRTTGKISGGLQVLGFNVNLSLELSLSGGWRRTSVCSYGKTCALNGGASRNQASERRDTSSFDDTEEKSEATDVHDAHRRGETHKTTQGEHDSQTYAGMKARGEHHTGSQSDSHSHTHAVGSMEGWTKHQSTSKATSETDGDFRVDSKKWDQISQALKKLFSAVTLEEAQLAKQIKGSMKAAVGCSPAVMCKPCDILQPPLECYPHGRIGL